MATRINPLPTPLPPPPPSVLRSGAPVAAPEPPPAAASASRPATAMVPPTGSERSCATELSNACWIAACGTLAEAIPRLPGDCDSTSTLPLSPMARRSSCARWVGFTGRLATTTNFVGTPRWRRSPAAAASRTRSSSETEATGSMTTSEADSSSAVTWATAGRTPTNPSRQTTTSTRDVAAFFMLPI